MEIPFRSYTKELEFDFSHFVGITHEEATKLMKEEYTVLCTTNSAICFHFKMEADGLIHERGVSGMGRNYDHVYKELPIQGYWYNYFLAIPRGGSKKGYIPEKYWNIK